MKAMMFGLAGVLMAGTYLGGGFNRADAVRTVDLPVDKVYDEFADAMQPEGPSEIPFAKPGGAHGTVHVSLEKVPNASVALHADMDDKRIFSLALRFEPVNGGASTRILADTDIDMASIKDISGSADAPPQILADMSVTRATRAVLDKAVDDLEHGRHLTRSRWAGGSGFYSLHSDYVSEARTSQYGDTRSAAAPMQSARPMIDPSEEARRNMVMNRMPSYR